MVFPVTGRGCLNEAIEVQFRLNGRRLRVKRQLPGGIEFDERDPLERTIGIEFSAQNDITRMRLDSIRRIQGWPLESSSSR